MRVIDQRPGESIADGPSPSHGSLKTVSFAYSAVLAAVRLA